MSGPLSAVRRATLLGVALAWVGLGAACGGAERGGAVGPAPSGSGVPGGTIAVGPTSGCPPVVPRAVPFAAEREAALLALVEDRPSEARALLEPVVRKRPNDLAAQALFVAAEQRLRSVTRKAGDSAGRSKAIALESPPTSYTLRRTVPGLQPGPTPKLVAVSNKANLITDDAAWFKDNGIKIPSLRPQATDLPEHVPSSLAGGGAIRAWFPQLGHDVAAYGSIVGVFAANKEPRVFDASATMASSSATDVFGVNFAAVSGSTLLVQTSRNGYSKDVGGKTAFITAYDTVEGRLLWQSAPLVANGGNFIVTRDYVIAGYGFTAEPDFLYVLDLATGKTLTKTSLPSGPSAMALQGDKLLVRTYDHDLVFRLEPAPAAATPPVLAEGRAPERSEPDPELRCWLGHAVGAIDVRSPTEISRAVSALASRGVDVSVTGAFDGVRRFLEQQAGPSPALDLSTRDLLVAEAPPWEARRAAAAAPAPKLRLVQRSRAAADPVRGMAERGVFREGRPSFIAPVEAGKLPRGARPDIPSSYGLETLRAIIPNGARTVLIYGGRHVLVVEGSALVFALDLEAYRHPPAADPQWAEFAVQDATYAREEKGVLYVCNGGGSYAKEVFGKKGFVSAIDAATGRLLWRSDALVCNSSFDFVGDALVTGYGFTAEPDFLFALSKATGEILARSRLDSGPDEVRADGDRIAVEAYAHSYTFELSP